MRFAGILLAAVFLPAAQAPHFGSSVDLVSLNVRVTDQSRECFTRYPPYWNSGWDGCPVAGLAPDAFEIFEDGVRQQIEVFQSTDVPVAVSLVIDTRSTSRTQITGVQDAAVGLLRKLRSRDVAAIAGGDGIDQPFTNDRVLLEKVIRRMPARASISFGDYFAVLTRELESPQKPSADAIRRHAIVFLTDGEAASREVNVERTFNLARRSRAMVYAIAVTDRAPLDSADEVASSLRRLATLTGGRAFFPQDVRSLPSLYSQIYDDMSRQYSIGYLSNNLDRNGRWRSIEVRVDRPHAAARTRQGYFAVSEP